MAALAGEGEGAGMGVVVGDVGDVGMSGDEELDGLQMSILRGDHEGCPICAVLGCPRRRLLQGDIRPLSYAHPKPHAKVEN